MTLQWIDEPDKSTAEIRLGWVYLHFRVEVGKVEIDNCDGWGWDGVFNLTSGAPTSIADGKQLAEQQWDKMKRELP